jgi:hypothetical protein
MWKFHKETTCSHLKQTKVPFFAFYKNKEQEGRTHRSCQRVGASGRGKEVGRGYRRVNMVPILCTHVCKWKKESCCNYSRNERGE